MDARQDRGGGRGAPRVVALVPAAGMGTRLGADRPKAFVTLAGVSLLRRAVDGLRAAGVIDAVVVMVPAELVDETRALLGADATVVVGGAERPDSVRAGLAAAGSADIVLVHDAARCLTPPAVVRRVVAAVAAAGVDGAVVPVVPVADTIKRVDAAGLVVETPPRADLRAVQTPQGFTAALLRRAHASGGQATDDAGLVEALGVAVRTVPGDQLAFKITTPPDLALARAVLAAGESAGESAGIEVPGEAGALGGGPDHTECRDGVRDAYPPGTGGAPPASLGWST